MAEMVFQLRVVADMPKFFSTISFVAFLSSMANLQAGSEFMPVFIFTATAAIMAYTFGYIGDTIWYGQPLKPFLNDLADSILFGLLTGVMFALLWPGLPEATLPGVTG